MAASGGSRTKRSLQGGARRILHGIGLTRLRTAQRLERECARLRSELNQSRAEAARLRPQPAEAPQAEPDEKAPRRSPHTERPASGAPAPDPARQTRTIHALRRQISFAKAEIAFRTRRWRRAERKLNGSGALRRYGFAPLSLSAGLPRATGPRHVKHYKERLALTGLEAQRACWLELSCLLRLHWVAPEARDRFPLPIALDPGAPSLTMTDLGWSLDMVPAHASAAVAARLRPRVSAQVTEIVSVLEQAGIAHLDIHDSGRNIVVNTRGRLALIDFDIAAMDGMAISATIERRLQEWHRMGGYDWLARRMRDQALRFCDAAPPLPG
ncbi:hypothetical protein SAMN05421538_10115 [Paracoccus isoporae]|uniref:Uncharacterized protein n=1 Tax=Paracoccus isoporae TaxID=591205 RepID=A0A1G6SJW5_9RHOB|nr:hypothetical protein [Paracoccus isoporae]SDD17212.1 hypothetical protein SAMN05421538_10115 [Paracoccus isoporae]